VINYCEKRLIRQIQQTVYVTGAVRALEVRMLCASFGKIRFMKNNEKFFKKQLTEIEKMGKITI